MESSGRKKINPRQIDEKAILEKVAALGAQGIYSSSSSKAMPVRKEDDIPLPEAGGISEEQEIGEYINSHLNDFSSPGRNPLHIDKEAYRLLSDLDRPSQGLYNSGSCQPDHHRPFQGKSRPD